MERCPTFLNTYWSWTTMSDKSFGQKTTEVGCAMFGLGILILGSVFLFLVFLAIVGTILG